MCVGVRTNVATTDLSDMLPEEVESEVKLAAEISMGTEVSEEDISNIMHLCDQVCVLFASLSQHAQFDDTDFLICASTEYLILFLNRLLKFRSIAHSCMII